MPKLKLETNLADPDGFYELLMDVHRDCSPGVSERINARLILLLANHVGDMDVLKEALAIAAGAHGDESKHQNVAGS